MDTDSDTSEIEAPDQPVRDRGWTLPEVLVAIVLTGSLVIPVILASWTVIRASAVTDDQAAVEAVLGAAADELAVAGWQSCPVETGDYLAVAQTAASRVEWPASAITIDSIRYWDISTNSWSSTNPFAGSGSCEMIPTIAASSRMQVVTLRATSPNGNQTRTLDVVVAEIKFLDEQENP